VTAREASHPAVPARSEPLGSFRMIRVYSTADCCARAITFGDDTPAPPLELVRTFEADQREAAWDLLHELGRIWAPGRGREASGGRERLRRSSLSRLGGDRERTPDPWGPGRGDRIVQSGGDHEAAQAQQHVTHPPGEVKRRRHGRGTAQSELPPGGESR
jgi:hypothetical protein